MQIGFKVWQDILKGKDTNELYYSFYIFLVLKVNLYYLIKYYYFL